MSRSAHCLPALAVAALALATLAPALARAETVVGLTAGNDLVTFDSGAPSLILRRTAVTGLAAAENVVAIDFRPADGGLYGLTNQSRLYVIDRVTGAATAAGTPVTPLYTGTTFGLDFNPVVDRIRVVTDADENSRVNPTTGALAATDTVISYSPADVNVLANPFVVAVAYDRSAAGATQTTLFGIDASLDVLVRQGDVNGTPTSPNTGVLRTIGALGVDAAADTSFDISSTGAFAAITLNGATSTGFYAVDLVTGAVTLRGTIGGGVLIRGMAVAPVRFYGITVDDELVTFQAGTPGVVSTPVVISGMQIGEHVLAADVRPATGGLYVLGSTGRLYRVDAPSGAAFQVGTGTPAIALAGNEFGMDFNPVADRIRVVSESGLNFRIHPDTGLAVDGDAATAGTQPDGALAYDAGDANSGATPFVVAGAYDGSFAGSPATTLFGIDSNLDVLVRQGSASGTPVSPNSGVLTTVGPLGVNTGSQAAFDVVGTDDRAFAVLSTGAQGPTQLFSIDLTTGAASLVGPIGGGKVMRSVTAAPGVDPRPLLPTHLVALTAANEIVSFFADAPGTLLATLVVTGLANGENLVGIDVRPSTGVLYGVSSRSRLYSIDRTTGAATLVGVGAFSPALAGSEFGVDFNPVVDRIRVVSASGQNLRLNPDTGEVVDSDLATAGAQPDTTLAYGPSDPHSVVVPDVQALAYDRNAVVAPAASTLFGIDATLDEFVTLGSVDGTPLSPNSGQLASVGPLGVDASAPLALEIARDGSAFAAFGSAGGISNLNRVDLVTGGATLIGQIGLGASIRGLSIAPTADLPPSPALTVSALKVAINFAKSGKDAISLSGVVPAPVGALAGQTVVVNVGGVVRTFTLDAKGKAKSGDDTFTLGKPKNGISKFAISIKKEDVSDLLADEGLTGDATVKKVPRSMVVTLALGGTTRLATVAVEYTAKAGKSGSAKRSKT